MEDINLDIRKENNKRPKSKEIRKEARANLKGFWNKSALVVLVYFLLASVIGEIILFEFGIISLLYSLIIITPLLFGLQGYFLNRTDDTSKFSDLFEVFKSKNWIQSILTVIVFVIGSIITLIPIIALLTISSILKAEGLQNTHAQVVAPHFTAIMLIPIIIGTIIGLAIYIPFVIYAYTYSQVIFIAIRMDKYLNIKQIFHTSRMIMRGNKWRLFRLQITYIWWYLLALLPIGIGMFWFVPYYLEGQAIFFNTIAKEYEAKQNA